MMPSLSPFQRSQYIMDGGEHCPFCGSEDMTWSVDEFVIVEGRTVVDNKCQKCASEWSDVYQLINILEPLESEKEE
tara:strand:+ start:227 stop:454 length:228 start_codon:yes stop_codon:yes gene_type:complete